MKCFFLLMLFISQGAWAQLNSTVELSQKLTVTSEDAARKELLHEASLKSMKKFAPEMGYNYGDYLEKLNSRFATQFNAYKDQKLVEKFGTDYKNTLSEADKKSFFDSLEPERHNAFIKFSRTLDVLRAHTFASFSKEGEDIWKAKIDLDLDKIKLEKQFRKILSGETKTFQKIILVSEIDPYQFNWADLGLEGEMSFSKAINESWIKWMNDNLPSTVEEAVICDVDCKNFYNQWSETSADQVTVPAEYAHSVLVKVNFLVKRTSIIESLNEMTFEWEGRSLLQDITTKKIMGSFSLPQEKRTLRQMDQKALNSALASSLYRSPMTAFMQFNRKLEEKIAFTRVSKLVIQGQKNVGVVLALMEVLKTRGSSLGLELFLASFSKDTAELKCYYRGEEKSFTDVISGLKELKSSHSYSLVNEFTGVHYMIKLVTE